MTVSWENGSLNLRYWFRDPQKALPCAKPRRLTYFASKSVRASRGQPFSRTPQITKRRLPCLIAGDVNIDLKKFQDHQETKCNLDSLMMNNVTPTVVMPTRITANSSRIIDHIYYTNGGKSDTRDILTAGNCSIPFSPFPFSCPTKSAVQSKKRHDISYRLND